MPLQTKNPNFYFAFVLFSTTCRSFESGVVASLMGTIKEDLNMSYTMEGIVAASPDFGIVPAGILAIFLFQYFPAYRILVAGQFTIGLAALIAVVIPTALSLVIARALGGLFWGFAAVHYPSWINKYGGENETVWLGLFNSCLLIGILFGYGIGAVADTTNFITWRHLYGFEAVLMLITGVIYCFMSPDLIQVLPRVRPLNILKVFGGKCFVGGGDAASGTIDKPGSASRGIFCCSDQTVDSEAYERLEQEEMTDEESEDDKDNNTMKNSKFYQGQEPMPSKSNSNHIGSSYQQLSKVKKQDLSVMMQQQDPQLMENGGQDQNGGGGENDSLLGGRLGGVRDVNKIRAREAIMAVLRCPLYIWTVSTGAIMQGAVCFILYFITQVLKDLSFFGTQMTYICVGIIFVTSPIPGNIFGAWYVQTRLGGYRNFSKGLRFTWMVTICSFFACVILTIAALMKSAWGASAGPLVSGVYVAAFYLYLFSGAAPTATINGAAVSLIPKTSIAGSGVQFSFQNTGRLIVPAIGGMVIDFLGDKVVLGFQIVLLAAGAAAILTSFAGYKEALKNDEKVAGANGMTPTPSLHNAGRGSTVSPSASTYGGVIVDDSFDDHITL